LGTLVWFRNDLRVADNPALLSACEGDKVIACFVVSGAQWRDHDVGNRRLAFLGRSVNGLSTALANLGISLEILDAPRFADVPGALLALAHRVGAQRLVFNAEYPSNEQQRDDAVEAAMLGHGIRVDRMHGGVTLPPGSVITNKERPYSVYTPFKRRWLEIVHATQLRPLPSPVRQGETVRAQHIQRLAGISIDLDRECAPEGEHRAHEQLAKFADDQLDRYAAARDTPCLDATSHLSAYLSVGTLSSNQCLHAAARLNGDRLRGGVADVWIEQLIWRDFYRHVVALFPHVSRGFAFRRSYDVIAWRHAPAELEAWQEGATGYPMVDAGMRQLRSTGWMHNRLRMIAAMFLTKHLLIDWRLGERYFMQQLLDGDFAANNGGWQWSASTGTDAAPYFRIFNPTTQGKRFDPHGTFTREILPELSNVPDRHVFEPHKSGVEIDYPEPIVDHGYARQRAIAEFVRIRSTSSTAPIRV
jgi:deoxyribodipyrimidine photo-lyase